MDKDTFWVVGLVLACAGSGMNKILDDLGADINNELTCKKLDISIRLYSIVCDIAVILPLLL